jgi:hypothetical protein
MTGHHGAHLRRPSFATARGPESSLESSRDNNGTRFAHDRARFGETRQPPTSNAAQRTQPSTASLPMARAQGPDLAHAEADGRRQPSPRPATIRRGSSPPWNSSAALARRLDSIGQRSSPRPHCGTIALGFLSAGVFVNFVEFREDLSPAEDTSGRRAPPESLGKDRGRLGMGRQPPHPGEGAVVFETEAFLMVSFEARMGAGRRSVSAR